MEVQFAPQADPVQNGEAVLTQRRHGMFGLSEEVKPVMPSMKTAPDLGFEKWWLPGMDSNHDSRLQRPLSYH